MKKFFASFAVGLPITFLGLIIFTGDVEFAVFLAVACPIFTFGLALLVPLGVGGLTLALIGIFVKKPDGKEEPAGKRPPAGWDMLALVKYMRHIAASGMTDNMVNRLCRANGWSDAEIQEARWYL